MLDRPRRSKRSVPERSEGQQLSDSKWTEQEMEAILITVLKYGTSNTEIITDQLPGRSVQQVTRYLRHLRACYGQSSAEDPSAVDQWLQAVFSMDRDNLAKHWGRSVASSAALRLAALDERRRVVHEQCADLSTVYLYLATLASNEVPARPDEKTSRLLLSLLHHLAALLSSIDTFSHHSWLYQIHQKLNSTLIYSPDSSEVPAVDSSLVDSLASSLFTNPLNVPANLLINPLPRLFGGDRGTSCSSSSSDCCPESRTSRSEHDQSSPAHSPVGGPDLSERVELGAADEHGHQCYSMEVEGGSAPEDNITLLRTGTYGDVSGNDDDIFDPLFGTNDKTLDLCRKWRLSSNIQSEPDAFVSFPEPERSDFGTDESQ